MIGALLAAATIAGVVPSALGAPTHVMWIAADGSIQLPCELKTTTAWRCDGVPGNARGLVVVVGSDAIAHQCVAVCERDSDAAVHQWARLLIIEPGGVAA